MKSIDKQKNNSLFDSDQNVLASQQTSEIPIDNKSEAYPKVDIGHTDKSLQKISTLDQIYSSREFCRYFDLLIDYNSRFNLTSLTNRDEVFLKHFYDSILPVSFFPKHARVLDIGSGAGFPAICLKLVRPDLDVTMLDSVGKKVSFLQDVILSLNLAGIKAIKSRIEDFAIRNFDVVTSRAVAAANILAEYSLPFVKKGGFALFYKANECECEINQAIPAITRLGGKLEKIQKLSLSNEIIRSFVFIKKIGDCPPIYPRKGNKPRLNPL